MHLSLGNTQRGIVGGWLVAVCAAIAGSLQQDVSWQKTLAGIILITGPVLGALIDPGSAPEK